MKRLTLIVTVALIAPVAVSGVAGAAEDDPASRADRYVIGLEEVPDDAEAGASFEGGQVLAVIEPIDALAVRAGEDFRPERVQERGDVDYVEPDVRFEAQQVLEQPYEPNDSSFNGQYGPQQIRADFAWQTTLGDADAAVCVVDTGVRYTHEDLADRWQGGHDYVNDDDDPMDDHGHGTHVAGIAAATTDNGVGIAGVGNTDLYGTKVLNEYGWGWSSDVAQGIVWCADNAGDNVVINLSLGGSYSSSIADALQYAVDRGALVAAAAGNSGCLDCVTYPASDDNAIAVTCTDWDGDVCYFSSTGPEAELAAPGYSILSTYAGSDSDYAYLSGTSMSSPHVAGAAALVWSEHTGLSNDDLRTRLQLTADDHGVPGPDPQYGFGEVDAECAMDLTVPCPGLRQGSVPPVLDQPTSPS